MPGLQFRRNASRSSVMLVTRPVKRALSGYLASMPATDHQAIASLPRRDAWVSWLILMILTFTVWPMVSTSVG